MANAYKELLSSLHHDKVNRLQLKKLQDQLSDASEKHYPNCIFFAYLPKTASTFLMHVLQKTSLYSLSDLTWGYSQNEQNLQLSQLIKYSHKNQVTKLMLKASDINLMLLKTFAIKPVILTRPFTDIIISLYDHFEIISPKWPQFLVPKHYDSLSKKHKIDLIIDHFTPWMIDFLESWENSEQVLGYKPLYLSYDDVTGDCKGSCQRIFDYYGLDFDLSLLPHYINESKTAKNYFNKGLTGRGNDSLTKTQVKRIESFFIHYPHLKKWL